MTSDEELLAELLEQCDQELRDVAERFSAAPGEPSSARDAFLREADELLDFRLMIMDA